MRRKTLMKVISNGRGLVALVVGFLVCATLHAQAQRATAMQALEAASAPAASMSTVRGDWGSSSSLC